MSDPTIQISHETASAPAGNKLVKHPDNISTGSWRRVTVAWIWAGQSRPYADSVYEADLCFEGGTRSAISGYDLPCGTGLKEGQVRQYVRLMVHEFKDEPPYTLGDGQLVSLSCIERGDTYSIWRARIVQPYTD